MKTIVTLLLLFTLAGTACPQKMEVPVEQQVPLFLKILSFDRNLTERAGKQIVLAVIYQKKYRESLDAKNEFEDVTGKSAITKIDSLPIKFIAIDMSDNTDLVSTIDKNQVDIIYLAPVKALKIESITAISRQKHLITLTGVPEYVQAGVAVGIGAKGDKPQILVNLPAAKAEGINFDSQLLKLAKIID
jgi:hypothetical protein